MTLPRQKTQYFSWDQLERQEGSAALDEASGSREETLQAMHPAVLASEGVRQWEQYCNLVGMETARDNKSLQSHAWVEGLLNIFFRATIGVPHMVLIISLTECMIFAPGCSKDLGVSYDESQACCQALSGIHPWISSSVQVTALQRTVKEGRYDIVVSHMEGRKLFFSLFRETDRDNSISY